MQQNTKSTALSGKKQVVIDAATKIFALHPYNAASIRMIAREGGFGHAIIGYYYPSKAALFKSVVEILCENLTSSSIQWLNEVRSMEIEEGFSRYVLRLIEFSREKPWVLRIMILNISGEKVKDIPAKEHIMESIESIRSKFTKTMRLNASTEEIGRFTDSFNAMALYYLGAPHSAAWLVRMDPESDDYFKWVHATMVTLFLPMLRRLFVR